MDGSDSHNVLNRLNATECNLEMVKIVNVMYALPQCKNEKK